MSYDDFEDDPPAELLALRARMSREDRLRTFFEVFHREPESDDELEIFIDEYTLELYNSGMDTGADFDPSL